MNSRSISRSAACPLGAVGTSLISSVLRFLRQTTGKRKIFENLSDTFRGDMDSCVVPKFGANGRWEVDGMSSGTDNKKTGSSGTCPSSILPH